MLSRKKSGTRRELLYLALAGMEVCYLAPIVFAFSHFANRFPPALALPSFFVVILIAFFLARLFEVLDLEDRVRRDITFLVIVVWLILSLRLVVYPNYSPLSLAWLKEILVHLDDRSLWAQDLSVIGIMLVCWWRGFALARRSLDVNAVGLSFRFGVLWMAGAVMLIAQSLDWRPTPYVMSFFFLALVAISLARAEEVGRWRQGVPFPFGAGWFFSILGAAALVILLASLLVAIATGENIALVLAWLNPLWNMLRILFLLLLSLIFAILTPLLMLLMKYLTGLMEGSNVEISPEPVFTNLFANQEEMTIRSNAFEPYEPILRVLLVILFTLIVALIVGRIWRARNRLGTAEVDSVWGERERTRLPDRFKDRFQVLAERLGFLGRWRAAISIRRIYAQMVALAERQGSPRGKSDTPNEFIPTLTELWPGMESEIITITQAYIRTHYGQVPESKAELDAIQEAWHSLRLPDR